MTCTRSHDTHGRSSASGLRAGGAYDAPSAARAAPASDPYHYSISPLANRTTRSVGSACASGSCSAAAARPSSYPAARSAPSGFSPLTAAAAAQPEAAAGPAPPRRRAGREAVGPNNRTKRHDAMTRLKYDDNTYRHDLLQSTGPGSYYLGTPVPHCEECFPADPRVRLASAGHSKCADTPLVDVDSELQGITRSAGGARYTPGGMGSSCTLRAPRDCREHRGLVAEDTRLSNPPCTLRGTPNGFNRWEALCRDPQAQTEIPFRTGICNRTAAKDNHRPLLPTPLDQGAVLPPAARSAAAATDVTFEACPGPTPPGLPTSTWRACDEIARY